MGWLVNRENDDDSASRLLSSFDLRQPLHFLNQFFPQILPSAFIALANLWRKCRTLFKFVESLSLASTLLSTLLIWVPAFACV